MGGFGRMLVWRRLRAGRLLHCRSGGIGTGAGKYVLALDGRNGECGNILRVPRGSFGTRGSGSNRKLTYSVFHLYICHQDGGSPRECECIGCVVEGQLVSFLMLVDGRIVL